MPVMFLIASPACRIKVMLFCGPEFSFTRNPKGCKSSLAVDLLCLTFLPSTDVVSYPPICSLFLVIIVFLVIRNIVFKFLFLTFSFHSSYFYFRRLTLVVVLAVRHLCLLRYFPWANLVDQLGLALSQCDFFWKDHLLRTFEKRERGFSCSGSLLL